MSIFIDAILSPVNLVLSLLLLGCLAYWAMVCFGALDIDSLDIDLDLDLDADIDADVDLDVPDAGGSAIIGSSLMRFLNIGDVPLMVLASVFVFILWAAGVLTHRYVGEWSVLLQLALMVPMVIGAALLTKIATAPLKSVFNSLEASEHSGEIDFIGKRCHVASGTLDDKHGQIEVKTDGSPIKLNAHLEAGAKPLTKGAEVVIVSYNPEAGVYRVRGF